MKPVPYQRDAPITSPGLYTGVPMDIYHGAKLCDGPSVSSSGLRTIWQKSPAHYWCKSPYNSERINDDESSAMVLGRAAHHLLLGEDNFSTLYIMRPEKLDGAAWQGNRTACKAWLAEQHAENRTVLRPEEIASIRGMAKSLAAHPLIKAGALNGAVEQTMVWRCKGTGIWLKARPDAMPRYSGDFVDLKTTTSVLRDDIARTIADYGYAMQAALVMEGYSAITGRSASSFSLVFVEKTPPHCVSIVSLADFDLVLGERMNTQAKRLFKAGIETGEWPGPGDANDAAQVALPDWQRKNAEYQLGLMEENSNASA